MAASWEQADPRFVLGSMLPDFAHMCGVRLAQPTDPAIAAGVDCHHRVDATFHQTTGFLSLCADARAQLHAAEVRRPTVLAAAHVGVELLLDGFWLEDPAVESAYRAALAQSEDLVPSMLGSPDPDRGTRLAQLLGTLRDLGPPHGYRDPTEVGRRITRILSRRPRLAATTSDAPRLVEWAQRAHPSIVARAPALREELRDGLQR